MNEKFDELAKNMAQCVTRRGALKKFGVGLAGIALALLGLPNKAHGDPKKQFHWRCAQFNFGCDPACGSIYDCVFWCGGVPKHYGGCSEG